MTCLPRAADTDRTVLETVPVGNENGWWTGLVRDRENETGEIRLRIERWVRNDHSIDNPHTWRVRPDFWDDERQAVSQMESRGGHSPPGNLPIDQRLTPLEYIRIRKDDVRWVAVVRVDRPFKGPCIRLYHWNAADESVRQKWTIGRNWNRIESLATRHLKAVA